MPIESSPKPKLRPEESLGSKIMSGIKSAGAQIKSDFKHSTGQEKYTGADLDDYKKRSADSQKAHMEFLDSINDNGSSSSSNAMQESGPSPEDIYAENLRRYNEYMQQQNQQQPVVTPDMRRAALDVFESQRGAGAVPYQMRPFTGASQENVNPAFQYAAQNFNRLGGSQRLAPRPMEMMSVAERRQINDMVQAMADQQAQQQAAANDYQAGIDMVMRGGGKGGGATMPQTGGQFNSMEELMEYQNQNPSMNLMGEYQRLKALEGGGQPTQMPGYGGMGMPPTSTPPNFTSMLAQRFGGFGGQ